MRKALLQPALPALESAVGATIASAASRWPESVPVPSTTATPPARRRPARTRATFACALLALFAGALAGCGSSDTPAAPAPTPPPPCPRPRCCTRARPSARPARSRRTRWQRARRSATRPTPTRASLGTLQTPGSAPLSFEHDLAPWLGPQAGVFLTSLSSASALPALLSQGLLGGSGSGSFAFGTGGAQGAVVLDTSDAAKAQLVPHVPGEEGRRTRDELPRRQLRGQLRRRRLRTRRPLRGDRQRIGAPRRDRHDPRRRRAVSDQHLHEAARDRPHRCARPRLLKPRRRGDCQRRSSRRRQGRRRRFGASARGHAASEHLARALRQLADARRRHARRERRPGGAGGLLAPDPEGAQALNELPGESWLAIGLGHVGATLGEDAQGLEALSSLPSTLSGGPPEGTAGLTISGLLQGLVTPLRELGAPTAQARSQFASWMGSAGIFASGANLLELKAGCGDQLEERHGFTRRRRRARRTAAQGRCVRLDGDDRRAPKRRSEHGITGLPVVLDIAAGARRGRQREVRARRRRSVGQDGAGPAERRCPNSATRSAAAASLGEGIQPSLIVDFPTFLGLLEGVGLIEAPSLAKFVPYLRSLTTLAGGGHQLNGGVQRMRLVLGLAPAGG